MRFLTATILTATLILSSFSAYAINVSVKSTNTDIDGLGFTTKGKQYGGMGSEYKKSGMSKGNYTFGLRVYGKDVGCRDANGNKQIKITSSSRVILMLKGRQCTLKVNS